MTDMYDSDENSRTHRLAIIDNLITFQNVTFICQII